MQRRSVLIYRIIALVCIVCAAGLMALSIAGEEPKGTLKGIVTAKESGVPLKAEVYASIVVNKQTEEVKYYSTYSDTNGRFTLSELPIGTYELSISSTAHRMKPVKVHIEESKTEELSIELAPDAPYLEVYVHQHVFTPDEHAQVTCSGFLKTDKVSISTYKVNMDQFLGKYEANLQRLVTQGANRYYDSDIPVKLENNPGLTYVNGFETQVKNKDREGVFTYRVDIPKLTPGLYIVAAAAEQTKRVDWFLFTSLGMVIKGANGKALAYTTDIKTGTPVPGCKVQIYSNGKQADSYTTNQAGLAEMPLPQSKEYESTKNIIAFSGDSIAFTSTWLANARNSRILLYSYTDRPVYRPGQRVYYKGIARMPNGAEYDTPGGSTVDVQVQDPVGTLVYRTTAKTNRFGSYSGSFTLPEDCATGYYNIAYTIDGKNVSGSAGFRIAEYRKPEFKASVDFSRKRYTRGQMIKAKVSSAYYFGAPVANAEVRYYIYRSDYWMYDSGDDGFFYGDEGYDSSDFGEFIDEGVVRTNDNGDAEIEFPAVWPQPKNRLFGVNDQQFTLEVTITDRSNQEASAKASVAATNGEFALNIQTDRYIVEPGDSVRVRLKAADYDRKPIANQQIELKVGKEKWTKDEYEFIEKQSMQVTTDSNGEAEVEIKTDKPEDMLILAQTRDTGGNRISATQSVWVFSSEWNAESESRLPDLKITTDKKRYESGETMTALISTSKPGSTALVTVEGEKIYSYFTVPLKNKVTKVTIPVKSEYRPNFYIGVCYVRNKRMVQQEAQAQVSTRSQNLSVNIKTDKKIYEPGDTVNATVTAKDSTGKPVVSEISLGIVDEAIYAIAEDSTTPINEYFYAKKPNMVRTVFSFPEIYLSDPDKAGADAATIVRKNFKDTAFWNPTVITHAKGSARVSFKLPDNITTWRATARAITSNTVCGEAKAAFTARKKLMVRLELPRFLTAGDSSTIVAAVHNYTGSATEVVVNLDAVGFKVDSAKQRKVMISKDGDARLDWPVSVNKAGKYRITVSAKGKEYSDAVEMPLTVIPHGVYREISSAGTLSTGTSTLEEVGIRQDVSLDNTRVKIILQPSLASTMMSSLDYLAQYPYGCTEQTTSAFLPDVVLWQSLKELGIDNQDLKNRLPDMVRKGLARLQRMQQYDGAWGWCEYGQADLWMTSYVTYALHQAQQAGFAVNTSIIDNALSALNTYASNNKIKPGDRVYAYYVLALYGNDVSGALLKLVDSKLLSAEGTAMAAMAFNRIENSGINTRRMYTKLLDMAVVESGYMHWEGSDKYGYQNVQATATGLLAMLEIDPKNAKCADVVRWLMAQRRGDIWYSTRDTAATLNAVSRYLAMTGELKPAYTASISLNGRTLKTAKFSSGSLSQPAVTISVKGNELKRGINIIKIGKSGKGNLYYSVNLQQYIERDKLPRIAGEKGPAISRAYYKPSARYFQSRSARDLGSPVTSCNEGDVILVKLTIRSSEIYEHLLLEDRLPAGFEVVDRGHVDYWDWGYWYSAKDIRDQKVSFYIDRLGKSVNSVEYQMRAMAKGSYAAMPAEIFGMYRPEVRTSTLEERFTVR